MGESMAYINFTSAGDYSEYRHHEVKDSHITMVDGNVVTNLSNALTGSMARVYHQGHWGLASSSHKSAIPELSNLALTNAQTLSAFHAPRQGLVGGHYQGEHPYQGKPTIPPLEMIDLLKELNSLAKKKYKKLQSISLFCSEESHIKHLQNSTGSRVISSIDRSLLGYHFTAKDTGGQSVGLGDYLVCLGRTGELDLDLSKIETSMDILYQHVLAKTEAVRAQGGMQTVVLSPDMAGMLAHESMGHPCEADLVLGGSVAGELLGQKMASELITMVDFAHSYQGQELLMPVYADDEGTKAQDALLIDQGILTGFMHNRETAKHFQAPPTGNARAFGPSDEPLVRMRNTAILPGESDLADMISEVEDGYYLMETSNGQADNTTEFMFGVKLGYEIKNGQLGKAIKDTTVSGSAIKMLSAVDAVSQDMFWTNAGYCGKGQSMVVSMGGPALRSKAHLGGE
jgi:TldD protein